MVGALEKARDGRSWPALHPRHRQPVPATTAPTRVRFRQICRPLTHVCRPFDLPHSSMPRWPYLPVAGVAAHRPIAMDGHNSLSLSPPQVYPSLSLDLRNNVKGTNLREMERLRAGGKEGFRAAIGVVAGPRDGSGRSPLPREVGNCELKNGETENYGRESGSGWRLPFFVFSPILGTGEAIGALLDLP